VLPDIIDKPLGVVFLGNGRAFCHTLLFTIVILVAGICLYRFRRNSFLLCIALGCVAHIVLDMMWLDQRTFLWPLFGWNIQTSNISFVLWMKQTFSGLFIKPSEYIPEVIGAISFWLFFIDSLLGRKISRPIKARFSVIRQNLFVKRQQKPVVTGLVLNKKAWTDYGKVSGLVEKVAD
jgi:membrane-bound metal-dependent hydrolase YbcI (DUF457 family)